MTPATCNGACYADGDKCACNPPRMHPSECQHGTPKRFACRACEDALATGEGIEGLRRNARLTAPGAAQQE